MADGAIVQIDGDVVRYRASSLWSCTRSLVAARQGYDATPPPPYAQKVFDAGNDTEEKIAETLFPVPYLRKVYEETKQQEVVLEIAKGIFVTGHIDGMMGADMGLEIKSQSDGLWESWTPEKWLTDPLWIKYAWQVSCYMAATGLPWVTVRVRRSDAEVAWCPVWEVPAFSKEQIRDRVMGIEELAKTRLVEKMECDVKNDFYCPYSYLHTDDEEMVVDDQLTEAVEVWQAWKDNVDVAQKGLIEARKTLDEALGGRSKVLLSSGWQIKKTVSQTKEHTVKGSTSTRLTVTKKDPRLEI